MEKNRQLASRRLRIALLVFGSLCSMSSFPAIAATVLLFDVTAQRSERAFGQNTTATPTGSVNFQLAISLDGSAYSYSDAPPPGTEGFEHLIDYSYEGKPPVNSITGGSLVDSARFAQNLGMDALYGINPSSSISQSAFARFTESQAFGISESKHRFTRTRSEARRIVDQNFPQQEGELEYFQANSLNDSLTLQYDYPQPQPDIDINDYDAYLAVLQELVGMESLFDFSHSTYYSQDVYCYIDGEPAYFAGDYSACTTGAVPGSAPYYGAAQLLYEGSATLVGISDVPLPATAWLFLSALLGLGLRKSGGRLQLRRSGNGRA